MNTIKLFFITFLVFLTTSCSQKTAENPMLTTAKEVALSEMRHHPELWMCDGAPKPKWEYTPTLMARAFLELYAQTGDTTFLGHVMRFNDLFIGPDGAILTYKKSLYNMDRVQGGNYLIILSDMLKKTEANSSVETAIETLRDQLREQPRTSEGGFWHKQVYPHQIG